MTNSLVTHLSTYVVAMFKDIAHVYTKSSDWKRDQNRLLHELAIHGHRVLTLDLPALCKHFDRCLAEEQYAASSCRFGRLKRGTKIPHFLGNIVLQLFSIEGKLRDTPDTSRIHAIRCLLAGLKKLKLACKQRSVDDAVKDFIAIEKETREPTLSWVGDTLDNTSLNRLHFRDGMRRVSGQPWLPGLEPEFYVAPVGRSLDILQRVCDRVSAQFGDLHNEGISERPKHGPGVVANQRRGTSKYLFRWWSNKLQAIFPYDLYATTNFGVGSDHDREIDWGFNHEFPSRLISVPKTVKTPRLIAAEPAEQQWIQQLVLSQLETRIKQTPLRHCVDFRSQQHSRELTLSASIDGSYATVDLKSASDRLSCWTVERAFRANTTLLERLHAGRTRWLRNSIVPRMGEYIALRKFGAQGAAVTFPVQSIIYACVAIACLLTYEGEKVTDASIERCARRVRVFGDDIIVPVHTLGILVEMLTYLGLVVNRDKTFGTGKFRESCGVDAYGGDDVTPAYLTNSSTSVRPSEVGSFVDVSNNFHAKGLWFTADWLRSLVDSNFTKLPITDTLDGTPGWFSFVGNDDSRLKKRFNKSLHYEECYQLLPRGKVETLPTKGSYRLFHWLISKPIRAPEENISGIFGITPESETRTLGKQTASWRSGWAPSRTYMPS